MPDANLFTAVDYLAARTYALADTDLDQPYAWRAHAEGARFALLGTYHELRELAVALAARRAAEGPPVTMMQRALAQYHAAYRDFQAVLLGVTDADWDREAAPGEWPLRTVVGHMAGTERWFYTLVVHGLSRQQLGLEPAALPDDEPERAIGPYAELDAVVRDGSMADLLAWYDARHAATLADIAGISDEESTAVTLWWEQEPLSLEYRLHRFDAHLRQHTVQVEKSLVALSRAPNEARRLLRLVYGALAEVEGAAIGAPGLGDAECAALAVVIWARAEEVAAAVERAHATVAAATAGDGARLAELLAEEPRLANSVSAEGLPAVMAALYHGQRAAAEALAAGADLWVWEGAALGRLDVVENAVAEWPKAVDLFARDGFTPLQLACYFGHPNVATWLIEQGADVNAVSRNAMAIQPIHAAAANGDLAILAALLDHGADVNARQPSGYTALHTAAGDGSVPMAELLLARGADPAAATDDGRMPLAIAQAAGHTAVAELLRGAMVKD
jgi:uncharacterized protein